MCDLRTSDESATLSTSASAELEQKDEAAKALAVLSRQPSNQLEMGQDDVLPQYHPALLTASLDFCEQAMGLLAQLATPEYWAAPRLQPR